MNKYRHFACFLVLCVCVCFFFYFVYSGVFVLFCVMFFILYTAVSALFFIQVYGPLPPGRNPIAVNKYHIKLYHILPHCNPLKLRHVSIFSDHTHEATYTKHRRIKGKGKGSAYNRLQRSSALKMEVGVSTTPRPLYPRERPDTHCTGDWVGHRSGLDACGKSRTPPPGFDPRTVQPVASRYID